MWVRFIQDFDFHPPEWPTSFVRYKAGMVRLVRRVCAELAIAKGKAEPCERPK